jgi:LysR family glycine cleavage system transcriptional activator
MKKSLLNGPILHAMRSFEASARHLSFARAAEELHVTPGAVSQQIKLLEDRLGLQLFHRLPRRIELTESGSALALAVQRSFGSLEEALHSLVPNEREQVLQVNCATSFALMWLVPRIGAFNSRHPDIQLHVTAQSHRMTADEMRGEGIQLAIRQDFGSLAELNKVILMDEVLLPVASPEFVERHPPQAFLAAPEARFMLHDACLFDGASPYAEWLEWLEGAAEHLDVTALSRVVAGGPQFNLSQLCLRAAAAGQGIAMGRQALVRGDLEAGRLVPYWNVSVRSSGPYVALFLPGMRYEQPIAPFLDWLIGECALGAAANS